MKNKIIYLVAKNNFFSQLQGVGGHIAHCKGIINAFIKADYNVILVTGAESSSIPIEKSQNLSKVSMNFSWLKIFSSIYKLKNLIIANKPSFIYTRYSVKKFYIPFILKKILPNSKIILEVNSIGQSSINILKITDQIALKSADAIICVSEQLSNQITSINNTLSSKIIVLQNGVDTNRFDVVLPKKNNETINLGYAGTLKSNYGIEYLIQAILVIINEGYDVRLNIAGTGPAKSELMALSGICNEIVFLGKIEYDKMPHFFSQQDILLYSTSKKNMFQSPIKLYEYMASGKSIIAMRTPTTESLIENNVSGILVSINDSDEIATQIKILINSPDLREKLGVNARACAKNHDWSERVDRLLVTLNGRGWQL